MEWLRDPQAWVALNTLTALEIVLGIDNILTQLRKVSRCHFEIFDIRERNFLIFDGYRRA